MAQGGSLEAFAGSYLELPMEVVLQWTEEYSEFRDAVDVGRGKARHWWEEQLRKGNVQPGVAQFYMGSEFGMNKAGSDNEIFTEVVLMPLSEQELKDLREKASKTSKAI